MFRSRLLTLLPPLPAGNIIGKTLEVWLLRTFLIGLANVPDDNPGASQKVFEFP
jgi:hypothetical protein